MRTVEQGADAIGESTFDALPARVQEALGELVGAAKEGLLALSVGVGLSVLAELMDEEVVRHEALSDRAGCETSPLGRRSGLMKLGAAELGRCRGRWEQPRQRRDVLGTARRGGPGKRDGQVYVCRNQWWNPLKWNAGSNLADMGRSATHTSTASVIPAPGGMTSGRSSGWPARRPR